MRSWFVWVLVVVPGIVSGEALTLARVTGTGVNLRKDPSMASASFGKVNEDEHLVVCGSTGEWVRVYLPRKLPVYVSKNDIAFDGKSGSMSAEAVVRMEPDRQYAEVGRIPAGTQVKAIRQYGVWWAIEPPLSLTAYVKSQFIKPVKTLSAADAETVLGGRQIVPLGTIAPAAEPPAERSVVDKPAADRPAREELVGETPGRARATAPPAPAREAPEAYVAAPPRAPGFEVTTWTVTLDRVWRTFMKGRQGRVEEWNFTAAKDECAQVASSVASEEEKKFAEALLAEIKRLEEVQQLLVPKPKRDIVDPEEPERGEDKPLAVGWVIGQGRYLNKPGTHALMNGDKVLFYLEGKGTDLDALVNRRVAVLAGTIEDLPPQYGCKLIKVERAKETTR